MSDKFYPVSLQQLLELSLNHLKSGHFFGIPDKLFFNPKNNPKIKTNIFGHNLVTPIGVAAGPHSQMSQNIIGAWLMGAKYIELKTVQTLDELEVAKPCIDMQDEGYNCEWSQELKIEQSFDEYLNAWIVIHILNHKLGNQADIGCVFNMSVGYNLEGILKENVQWFFAKMNDCSNELKEKIEEIQSIYPDIDKINISSKISDNITLSTMHGCPANEIESIAKYLLENKGLHTFVKLNPTLLGPQRLREILNKTLKFKTNVPDQAFEHDLKYADALKIIKSLQKTANEKNLEFGLKLTNTLESANIKNVFGGDVDMMYMSGRALHPISINLAAKLQEEFKGELQLSFSAGADAFNIADILKCGFKTVTVSSDLLKPGGYMRLNQYVENLDNELNKKKVNSINEFILSSANKTNIKEAALENLKKYAAEVLENKKYRRDYIVDPNIKTNRELKYFDCISAPCRDTCSTNQDIPEYMFFTSTQKFDKAYEVILRTNPFPAITGMVCDHLCQNKCTRVNYDNSLLIREVKRFISEQKEVKLSPKSNNGIKVGIIGAGPSGLSCAYYLALAGFSVNVYEAKTKSGGMVQYAIPGFRLTEEAIEKDFNRVYELGVNVHYNTKVNKDFFEKLKKDNQYVFIGAGAQLSSDFKIEGIETKGVVDSLDFLFNAKAGKETGLGDNVVIIGGGNTAMDAARTAYRIVGKNGKVTIVYRRTVNEMPADQGEIKAVIEEGMDIIELTAPEKIITENGKVKALLCSRMELKGLDSSGRPKPFRVDGSEFEIPCDTIIPAAGQKLDIDFCDNNLIVNDGIDYTTRIENVFIGGDALRGASTAINAIGDGRKAANSIMESAGIEFNIPKPSNGKNLSKEDLVIKRSKRLFAPELNELPLEQRKSFNLVSETLDKNTIIDEASRCLYCDEICNICTTVCPNFANFSYNINPKAFKLQKVARTDKDGVEFQEDTIAEIKQQYQILNIANFCNECGNCNTFCPTSSAPYKEKPKIHLTTESFNESKEGYLFVKLPDRTNLAFKHNNTISTLSDLGSEYIYQSDYIYARLTKEDFRLLEAKFLTPCVKQHRFENALHMSFIMKGMQTLGK
ncbi:MAG: putative selenate reductase subunit YgfK [Bacteroidetes bacterium]|nr:putative selenate reductase subunit YgfK [Bacteroidota bacterium]